MSLCRTKGASNYIFFHLKNTFNCAPHQRLFWMFRIITSLFIGVVLVGEFCPHNKKLRNKPQIFLFNFKPVNSFPLCSFCRAVLNYTNSWAEARMTTNATYKSFSNAVINAEVGLHVGLYGINVTLRGESLLLLGVLTALEQLFVFLLQD